MTLLISPLARAQKNLNQKQTHDLAEYIEQAEVNELELQILKDKYKECTDKCATSMPDATSIVLTGVLAFGAGFLLCFYSGK